jgi:hypothetical protein
MQYLGMPLTVSRLRKVHLQYLIDRIKARLASWKKKLLSAGGRRELVLSVLSSMPIYVMTALKIPKQIIQEIDKARRKFLWDGGDEIHGGKCKVNWQRVCRPIKYGGLGVSNLTKMGRALHLRWLWYEWTFPDKPWIGMPTPCDEQDAELFAASTTVTIGDNRKALFWESPWVSSSPLKTMAPNLYRHARRKKRTVANALQDNKWIDDIRHNLHQCSSRSSSRFSRYFGNQTLPYPKVSKTAYNGNGHQPDPIQRSQLIKCSSWAASHHYRQLQFGSVGHRPNAIFLPGCSFKIEYGRLIGCSRGSGQTTTSANYALGT